MDVKITSLDFRSQLFTDVDAQQVLAGVKDGTTPWVHVRCDNQWIANRIREIFKQAMQDGGQYEITILGGGAAVGVKKPVPSLYTYVPDGKGSLKQILIEDYKKEHGNDRAFR